MTDINRRKFLIAGAGVGAAGLLTGIVTIGWPDLHRAMDEGKTLGDNDGVLVVVTLYGGNDGLSTVIPYADNAYHDARPDLAYAPEEVLHLDSELGLNPALKGLSDLWGRHNLAIVRGVSYPKPDRSHFRSMDIWQTASPDQPVSTGWIGRWLDATGDDPLRAINIGAVLPMMAVGEKQTASALSGDSSPLSNQVVPTITALGKDEAGQNPQSAAICSAYRATRTFGEAVAPVLGSGEPKVKIDSSIGGLTFTQPAAGAPNPLKAQLDIVAQCINGALPTQVYMATLGGFDTHADEKGPQQQLLEIVDGALTPFMKTMSRDKHGKNVVVMVYSEFGRRVHANASQGTDHGAAGPVLILGNSVKGGYYGEQPSLTDLDDGDLKGTMDFRDIYYELLTKTLKTDPEPSVGPGRRDVGFL